MEFTTKPQLARKMLQRLLATHGRAAVPWFTADEAYGDNPGLRDWLDEQDINYVMAISCDTRFPTPPALGGPMNWPPAHPNAAGNASQPARAAKDTGSMTGCSSTPALMTICYWSAARSANPANWPTTSAAAAPPSRSPSWSGSPDPAGAWRKPSSSPKTRPV